jgi:hypothetical protein
MVEEQESMLPDLHPLSLSPVLGVYRSRELTGTAGGYQTLGMMASVVRM